MQYADFKSLTGDTADNVKGAEKVGKKTASQLIRKFGTLEAVLQNAEQIEKPSVRRSITENAERLRRFHHNGGAARHPSKINLAMYNYCKTMQK